MSGVVSSRLPCFPARAQTVVADVAAGPPMASLCAEEGGLQLPVVDLL